MAGYGVRIYNSSGDVTLDITDEIGRFIYTTLAYPNTNGSVTLSDINGKKTCEFGICAVSGGLAHHVYRSGNTIYWQARNTTIRPSQYTYVLVFLHS